MPFVLIRRWSREDAEAQEEFQVKQSWSEASISQRMPRIAGCKQKPRERPRTDSASEFSEGTNLTNTLISGFWPPKL